MSWISDVIVSSPKERFSAGERAVVSVKFSIMGAIRDSFTEENWTRAYDANDVSFKLRYGVRLVSGGFRKRAVGIVIDSYRKASIFWTRNPKLVNPMKDRRVWVQVAKNFTPIIRLTEEEVREELFDFDETISFRAFELGTGSCSVSAEVQASWQKHAYIGAESCKSSSAEIKLDVN